jgi:ADP-ribose pyrophosphatase YjhB (NUDIX family)
LIAFMRGQRMFNYRVAGVALRDERVLLQRDGPDHFWNLPGGPAEMGELSAETLRRAMHTALGLAVDVGRSCALLCGPYRIRSWISGTRNGYGCRRVADRA